MPYEERMPANEEYDIILTVMENDNRPSQLRLEIKHWNHAVIGAGVRLNPDRVKTLIQSLKSVLVHLPAEKTR